LVAASATGERIGGARRGAPGDLARALAIAACAWLGCAVLQLLLYLRPGPYGGPFLLEWRRYFGLSLYFDLLGVWLLSAPFLILWLVRWRFPLSQRRARLVHWLHAGLLAANLLASALDHEVIRYLGSRLSVSFLATYAAPSTLQDPLFQEILWKDEGGWPVALLAIVAVPAAFLFAARRMIGNRRAPRLPAWAALALVVLPLAAPANGWAKATSQFRLRKTEPVLLAIVSDLRLGFDDLERPTDYESLSLAWQRRWLRESADPGWRFPDAERPYLRVPVSLAEPSPSRRWNLIYIQLESLRGVDVGFLSARQPSPTPFLDALAAKPTTAVWTNASSFGMPTINGMFATHCSITPHSRRFITSFTATHLYCFPEALRRRGYRTEMFNAGDTDWDNSTFWLSRWYDRLWRFPYARQQDRPVFRAAAARIRELGRSGRPFLAGIVSISNHTPFISREPGLDIAGRRTPAERILNTTRYTDDVLREFIGAIELEPWFRRTIIVIVGDHGFNLGEHRTPSGQLSLYRESVWVPLLILADHPRLRRGRSASPATLLDVAPTVADLIGISEPVPWQGHSLLGKSGGTAIAFAQRGWRLAEDRGWSVVAAPDDERGELFERDRDWLQRRPLTVRDRRLAPALLAEAEGSARLNDYLLRNDRVAPAGRTGQTRP
jgi:phosphoglycerol transferase MdoB-like AlkP superfamily enzyme